MKLPIIAALTLLATPALAADLAVKAQPILGLNTACTPTSCTGLYVGANLGGSGTNADILGSGINNSIFAGGGIVGGTVGYQYSQNNWFLAAEASVNYEFQTQASINGVSGNANGFLGYEIVKLGGNVAALFNSTAAPVAIPPTLSNAVISPYILFGGVERSFANGWASGAGVTFDVGPHSFIDVKYMHVSYGPSSNAAFGLSEENLIFAGLNYKF